MLGAWRGASFASGHPLDGVLENFGWHGKRFDSTEHVHPLLFRSAGGRIVQVRAGWIFPFVPLLLRFPALRSRAAGRFAQAVVPLLSTRRSGARLRMLAFRGKTGAAMVYDDAPIIDVFRRMDDGTVLGMMDMKGMEQPFFFVLRREG
jgi:hypothetical protein